MEGFGDVLPEVAGGRDGGSEALFPSGPWTGFYNHRPDEVSIPLSEAGKEARISA